MSEPEIRISGREVTLLQGNLRLACYSTAEFIRALAHVDQVLPASGILPSGVRLWCERGPAVATLVEISPHCRSILWVADNSEEPFGRGAKYKRYFVSLPYIILLLVFFNDCLTYHTQLYFRPASLDRGERLFLPNLRNVAKANGYRSWVCLINVGELESLSWSAKIKAVVNHVLAGGFNLSGELHEGNSYWSTMRDLDPRVASMEAWEAESRKNPRFILEVPWKRAGTTATRELTKMLNRVMPAARPATSSDLAGLVMREKDE